MNCRTGILFFVCGIMALLLCAGLLRSAVAQEAQMQTVTGFRVPEYDEEGNLKYQIFGDFAKLLPNGVIEIAGLKVEMYKDGKSEATVTAPSCTYDKEGGRAGSESAVRIVRENLVVTGDGFYWNSKNEKIQIFKNARVELVEARRAIEEGVKP